MHLLRRRAFALLFSGMAINAIGSWTALMALWGFAADRFDASPGEVAALALAWSIPASLIGPLAGVPIDRFGPRRVLIAANVLGAATALVMLLADSYSDLIGLGVFMGLSKAFSQPAAAALPPRIVDDEDLVAANALLGAASDSAIVFGPLLAAGSIALWGFDAAFVIDALTFMVGIAVVLPLRLRDVEPPPKESLREELAIGLRLARRSPGIRFTLLQSTAVYLTWSAFVVVEPLYVRDVLGRSPTVFAMLQVAFGVGLVATGFLVSRLGDRAASPRALALAVLLSGAAAGVYVGTSSLVVAAIGVFLWGCDVAFFGAPSRTLLQRHAPVAFHGRVLALQTTLHSWSDLVAIPVTGVVAGVLGIQEAAMVFVTLAVVSGGLGYLVAGRIDDEADAPRGRPGRPLDVVETGVEPVTTPPASSQTMRV